MPTVMRPHVPATLDNDDVPEIRRRMFELLYENIEGMSALDMSKRIGVSSSFMNLIAADAFVEGELKRVDYLTTLTEAEREQFQKGFEKAAGTVFDHAKFLAAYEADIYRLSPDKWVEMESRA